MTLNPNQENQFHRQRNILGDLHPPPLQAAQVVGQGQEDAQGQVVGQSHTEEDQGLQIVKGHGLVKVQGHRGKSHGHPVMREI